MTPQARSAINLRVATVADAPDLVEVWSGVIRRAGREAQVAELEVVLADAQARDDVRVVVAEYDGRIAGAVYLMVSTVTPLNLEPALITVSPHVLPQYRRRGVGRALVDASVSWAEELGIGYIATAATAGARDANRFMARLALAPLAMVRVAPTPLVRAKLVSHAPATHSSRARVLSARRSRRGLGTARRVDPAGGL